MNKNGHQKPKTKNCIKVVSFLKVQTGKTADIVEKLKTIDSVKKILSITGNYDIIVELQTPTTDQLYEEFIKKVDVIPGLRKVHSNYVMKSWTKGGKKNVD